MDVFVTPIEKSLVLQARGSEILILPDHVAVLKGLKASKDFMEYFTYTALINRPARKLFEAWLRKDNALWKKVYDTINKMENVEVTKVSNVARVDRTIRNEDEKPEKVAPTKSAPKEKKKIETPTKKVAVAKQSKPAKKSTTTTKSTTSKKKKA